MQDKYWYVICGSILLMRHGRWLKNLLRSQNRGDTPFSERGLGIGQEPLIRYEGVTNPNKPGKIIAEGIFLTEAGKKAGLTQGDVDFLKKI